MAQRTDRIFAFAVLCLLLLSGCSSGAPADRALATSPLSPQSPLSAPPPAPGPLALTLIHSNDTWGYIDPCG